VKSTTPTTRLYIEEAKDQIALDNDTGIEYGYQYSSSLPQYTIGESHQEEQLLLIGKTQEGKPCVKNG